MGAGQFRIPLCDRILFHLLYINAQVTTKLYNFTMSTVGLSNSALFRSLHLCPFLPPQPHHNTTSLTTTADDGNGRENNACSGTASTVI